jgi:hypothetical protein
VAGFFFARTTPPERTFVTRVTGGSWPVVRFRHPVRELNFAASNWFANLRFERAGAISATGHFRTNASAEAAEGDDRSRRSGGQFYASTHQCRIPNSGHVGIRGGDRRQEEPQLPLPRILAGAAHPRQTQGD